LSTIRKEGSVSDSTDAALKEALTSFLVSFNAE